MRIPSTIKKSIPERRDLLPEITTFSESKTWENVVGKFTLDLISREIQKSSGKIMMKFPKLLIQGQLELLIVDSLFVYYYSLID